MSYLDYFAYGSNLHPQRLRERIGSCRIEGRASARGYALRFHKAGQDGSAKCNMLYTGNPEDAVHGVIYRISAHEKTLLDHYEGLGRGYQIGTLAVEVATEESRQAFAYLAQHDHIDDSLFPYRWYRDYVEHGARYHGFPQQYIDHHISAVEPVTDPDTERAASEARVLASLSGQAG